MRDRLARAERGARARVRRAARDPDRRRRRGEVVAGDPTPARDVRRRATRSIVAQRLQEQARARRDPRSASATYRLARDAIEAEPIEPLALKGKAEPVDAYRLLGVGDGAPARARLASPMVGRGRERAPAAGRLRPRRAASARASSSPSSAPPGVGKSRLVAECARRARRPRARPDRALPALRRGDHVLARRRDRRSRRRRRRPRAAIERARRGEPTAGCRRARRRRSIGSATAAAAEESFWAVRRLLEALARERPLVVVFDDIHWAEPTFLDLVEYLADWARGRARSCSSAWPGRSSSSAARLGRRKLNATSIVLEPLDDETRQLIENLLGGGDARPRVATRIARRPTATRSSSRRCSRCSSTRGCCDARTAAGSPQATCASCRAADDPGAAGGAARPARPPRSGRARARPRSIGQEFDAARVDRALATGDRATSTAALQALVRKELIVRRRPCGRGRVPLPPPADPRRRLRRDAEGGARRPARALRGAGSRARGDELELEEIVGYHLEQAHAYRVELGLDPADGGARRPRGRGGCRGSTPARAAGAARRRTGGGQPARAARPPAPRTRRGCCSTSARRSHELGEFAEAELVNAEERAAAAGTDAPRSGSRPTTGDGRLHVARGGRRQARRPRRRTLPDGRGEPATTRRVARLLDAARDRLVRSRDRSRRCRKTLERRSARAARRAPSPGSRDGSQPARARGGARPLPSTGGAPARRAARGGRGREHCARRMMLVLIAHLDPAWPATSRPPGAARRHAGTSSRRWASGSPRLAITTWARSVELLAGDAVAAEANFGPRRAAGGARRLANLASVRRAARRIAPRSQGRQPRRRSRPTRLSEEGIADDVQAQIAWRATRRKASGRVGRVAEAEELAREAVDDRERTDRP